MAADRATNNLASLLWQLPDLQLGNEELGKLRIGVLKMNCRKLFVLEVIASRRSIAQRLEDPRDAGNPRQWLLAGEGAEGNMIVDERGLGGFDDLLVRRHVGDALAVRLPKRIEQRRGEFFGLGRKRNG